MSLNKLEKHNFYIEDIDNNYNILLDVDGILMIKVWTIKNHICIYEQYNKC